MRWTLKGLCRAPTETELGVVAARAKQIVAEYADFGIRRGQRWVATATFSKATSRLRNGTLTKLVTYKGEGNAGAFMELMERNGIPYVRDSARRRA